MQLLWFLLIGFVAGWLAAQFMKGEDFGVLGNTALGVLGAFVGNWVFGILGVHLGGTIGSIVAAFVGAAMLLWVAGMVKKKREA